MSEEVVVEQQTLNFSYTVELWMYAIAIAVGFPAFGFTCFRLSRTSRQQLVLAARLFSFKLSLTAADTIVLFIYAPTQFFWINSYWWFGGDIGCRLFKFLSTFGFHLTANMQVLVAADRLLITAKMNRLNRNMKKRKYNTRLSLAAAWILALVCAFPQLILFRQALTEEGHPQCISIWTERRGEYYEKLFSLEAYSYHQILIQNKSPEYFHSNGTMKLNPPKKPEYNLEELNNSNLRWLLLERLYNVLHLATICALPLAMEFICYILILYILKGASRGQFVTLSEVFLNIFCFCCRRKMPTSSSEESNLTANKVVQRNSTNGVAKRETSKSSAQIILFDNDPSSSVHRTFEEPTRESRKGMCQKWVQMITPKEFNRSRRSSASEQQVHQIGATNRMWLNTVDKARRNARWKAFIMLSMNLLFWGPYCMLAIMSSVTVSEWLTNFQFVNALITFNAVSNIIL